MACCGLRCVRCNVVDKLWLSLIVSLLLTEAIELVFALVWGVRGRELWLVVLVNLLTNPLAVLGYALLRNALPWPPLWIQLPIELMVFVLEALLYLRLSRTIRRPLLFALCINLVSYGLGLVIGLLF